MRRPLVRFALLAAVLVLVALAWRGQLVRVGRDPSPRPLVLLAEAERRDLPCDVVLPTVPVGMTRVHSGGSPLLIHYWAAWERDGRTQAAALDSLVKLLAPTDLRVVMVSSDPFPSVARFVQRQRLKLRVLLDGPGLLQSQIPRPQLPHTVLIGRDGRAAVVQSGPVDWLGPETRATLEDVIGEPAPELPPDDPPRPAAPPAVIL
jgi:peroxiredoxin